MGCMLRSDMMTKCQMYLQREVVFDVLAELGEMGCVQFIDLYPDRQLFSRHFVVEVCRFSEMDRKLAYIQHELEEHNIEPPPQKQESIAKPLHEMSQFEIMLDKWETDLQDMTSYENDLLKTYLELREFHYVLTYIGPMLGGSEIKKQAIDTAKQKKEQEKVPKSSGRLMVITGVVRRSSAAAFELILWRISHGIIYYKLASQDTTLTDPQTRKEVRKVAILIICQGEQLARRVQKICTGFKVTTFPCPDSPLSRAEMQEKLAERIKDLEQVLIKTKYTRCKVLREMGENIQWWRGNVKKSKAIYHTMNMFRCGDNNLIADCWIPDNDLAAVNKVFEAKSEKYESNVCSFNLTITTDEMPPTYHRVNKFTRGFQNLINAYGDSTYRELNPGLYTIITFPFLFAMMFGDLGHGFILVLFGLWMWKNESYFIAQKSTNEIWNILFGGRYIILLMGVFSCYTGFLYNDLFSRAFSLRSSYWINQINLKDLSEDEYFDMDPTLQTRKPYYYGEDPVWRMSKNKIMFENSFKMKISIIVGIIHMMFGIALSFFNFLYFKKTYAIFFQFIPEIMFLTLLFFWLVLMIFLKWFLYSPKSEDQEFNTACAPQILILFIDMVLMSTTKPANEGCTRAYMFDMQQTVQTVLVMSALACVPVLLFGSPMYKTFQAYKKRKIAVQALNELKSGNQVNEKREEELNAEIEKNTPQLGELMIHQGVHTIEYVLSTISHTASYLRLWALSLAHSQLSEMLWDMILSKLALQRHKDITGALWLIPIFTLWAVFTMAILVVMEGLSAFLHCLRLHWVEFMSKFYGGGGWPFRPFSFEIILSSDAPSSFDAACKKYSNKDDGGNVYCKKLITCAIFLFILRLCFYLAGDYGAYKMVYVLSLISAEFMIKSFTEELTGEFFEFFDVEAALFIIAGPHNVH